MEQRRVAMATRVSRPVFAEVQRALPELAYHEHARIAVLGEPRELKTEDRRIAVLCAGTSDLPVAEEAAVTAELFGYQVDRVYDVGVAGLHRLLDQFPIVRQASVTIVVAGMDGALPSVVGGLVRQRRRQLRQQQQQRTRRRGTGEGGWERVPQGKEGKGGLS